MQIPNIIRTMLEMDPEQLEHPTNLNRLEWCRMLVLGVNAGSVKHLKILLERWGGAVAQSVRITNPDGSLNPKPQYDLKALSLADKKALRAILAKTGTDVTADD